MATIDYEKKYEEALERARQFFEKPYLEDSAGIVGYIFPELRELEDERIRKALIELSKEVAQEQFFTNRGTNLQNVLDWIEKQGEQNTAWTEEDEKMLKRVIDFIPQCMTAHGYNEYINWFKSLKDRVLPKPAEWSEEDEAGLGDALWAIKQARTIAKDENDMGNLWYAEDWLKSLRPKTTWKPSDKQMKALYDSIPEDVKEISEREMLLNELYKDLKKL